WSSTSLGKTTAYQLSPLGSVRSVTQSGGTLSIQRATRESDSLGIDRRATAPGNRVTRTVQSHDANGQRQETLTRPDGSTVVQRYFRDGRLQSVSGTATVPIRIEYGTENHQAFRKEILLGDLGEETEWVQTFTDMAGRVTRIVRSHESGVPAVATNHYNAKGQLVRTVDPDGVTLLFAYNDLGDRIITAVDLNRNGLIDPAGPDRILSTERSWSTRGGKATRRSVAKVLTSAGSTSSTDLVVTENTVEGWDIWNTVAGLTFHESTVLEGQGNRTLTRTFPDGTREVTRIIGGRIASLTRLAATGARISLEEYGYDPLGRLVSSTDARTGATTLTWDENDQMVSLAEPGDRLTSFAYDAAGRIVQTVFPDGGVVVQGWTPLGLLQSQSGARTYPITFAYDSQGRRTSMTTTAGITRWSYHPESGRLAGKLHPDQRGLTYTYTAAGRLARRTSARGIVTAYSYDAGGEVSLIDYSDATPDLTYQRDRIGQIISVAQASGMTTSFQYAVDLSGEVESESISGGPLHGITIDPGYDALQRRDRLLVSGSAGAPWSHAQSYAYDPAGRLSGIATAEQAFAYSYLTDSDLLGTTVSRTNGQPVLTVARMWDSKDRLASVTSAAASGWGQQYAYHHNTADLRDRVTREDGSHREVAYDALGQVTGVTGRNQADQIVPGEEFRYTYNAIGNRLTARQGWAGNDTLTYVPSTGDGTQYGSISHPGLTLATGRADSSAVITIDGQPVSHRQGDFFAHELRLGNAAGPAARTITIAATRQGLAGSETETREAFVPAAVVTPEYDYDGNLTFDGWLEYTWDAENRLKTIKPRTGLSPPGSASRDFRHAFTYDHAGRRIRRQTWVTLAGKEYPAADDLFVYDGWNQVAVLHADTKQPRQTYTWGLDASQSLQGAGGVGGLLKLTDAATGTSHFPAYDGNGNLTALVNASTGAPTATYDYDPFGNLLQATGPFAENNPWRFSTKPVDEFTGQYFYGYRDYDPAQGRWLSRDPLGEAGGVNLYGFVGNDGVGQIDLLGLTLPDTTSTTSSQFYEDPITNFYTLDLFSVHNQHKSRGAPMLCSIAHPGCSGLVRYTDRDSSGYIPLRIDGRLVSPIKAKVPYALGHGNWIGDTRVNGTFGVWQEGDWGWPSEGEVGFSAPIDNLDRCGYIHDLQLRECGEICDPALRKQCRLQADKRFYLCATLHGKAKPYIAWPFSPGFEPNNNPGIYHPRPVSPLKVLLNAILFPESPPHSASLP
ncbi:MAG: hypothetical protein KGS60_19460, partial [Verrucomicrobia bacterium]|nr:hypothetical protein [Verrucomicrobiota bacterium]